jgi:signal transduction histidine kinase
MVFLLAMSSLFLLRLSGLILCFLALVSVGIRLSQSRAFDAPASLVGSQIFLAITCLLLLFFLGRYTSLQINREPEMSLVAAVRAEAANLSLRLAEQEQRFQIAREISEVVLQDVTAVLSQAEGGSYAAKVDPDAAGRVLQRISIDARSAHQELRRLYSQLNRNLELQAAPPGIDDLEALVISLREFGYSATLSQSGNRFSITEGAELAIYRMIFDALENIKQHVPIGASVSIDFIWVEDGMQFLVKDNGIETLNRELRAKAEISGEKFDSGYDVQTDIDSLVQPVVGLSITTMRERAGLYGGSVDVNRVPGVGFTVSAIFPHLKATAGRSFND